MESFTMANATTYDLPPLPSYTLTQRPSLVPGVSDLVLQTFAPIAAYWIGSAFFEVLDHWDLFPQYRLHTPAELLKRNHVTRWEVLKDVIVQHVIQIITGIGIGYFDPPEMIGREQYDVAVWAQRLRKAEYYVPRLLTALGFNAPALAAKASSSYPTLAGFLAGGRYATTGFANWELSAAKSIYWVLVPALQFTVAIFCMDTYQYFLHRAMHMNKFLYNWLHSRHHRLYVPYAFGALYNHPIEGFVMDTIGAGGSYLIAGMSLRQGALFFMCTTIKTIDDHCGYLFPWDFLHQITSNNAAYHDVHHQSWGIKTNFSQPFTNFWDRILSTNWAGGDVTKKYQRDRMLAQRKVDADKAAQAAAALKATATDLDLAAKQAEAGRQQLLQSEEGAQVLQEEVKEEMVLKKRLQQARLSSNFDAKAFSDKVSDSIYVHQTPILKTAGVH